MFDHPIQLDWSLGPMGVLRRWPSARRVVMLHSGRFDARWARYSILAEPTGDYRYLETLNAGKQSQWTGPSHLVDASGFNHHPSHDLRHLLRQNAGLWIGYLGYELGQCFEPEVLDGPSLQKDETDHRHWPLVDLACCPGWLVYDASLKQWSAHGTWSDPSRAAMKLDWWRSLPDMPVLTGSFTAGNLTSQFTRSNYESTVARVMDYIAAGDIFQANLTQRFTASFQGEYPLAQRAAFDRLNTISPAWYGAYLETAPLNDATAGRVIASTSPELFLELNDHRQIVTRPIKGTRPASVPASELAHSEKDKAELNMIVDLLRNDLGRVCDYGSVKVPEPRTIETHPTIHHGVSTILGRLHEARDLVDLLRACLPGGSITGAPKIRAMQIIRELEPAGRGPYCGSIGYLSLDTCNLNIAIRTMLIDPVAGRVDFSAGGGIVADSDPASEYAETITKASAILQTLGLAPPTV